MITAQQAADTLGMSVRFVYGLGASGHLTKYKFGKAVRFELPTNGLKAPCSGWRA